MQDAIDQYSEDQVRSLPFRHLSSFLFGTFLVALRRASFGFVLLTFHYHLAYCAPLRRALPAVACIQGALLHANKGCATIRPLHA